MYIMYCLPHNKLF